MVLAKPSIILFYFNVYRNKKAKAIYYTFEMNFIKCNSKLSLGYDIIRCIIID